MNAQNDNCILCGIPCGSQSHTESRKLFNCGSCGQYQTASSPGNWGQVFEESKHLLAGIARERTEQNLEPVFIDPDNISDLLNGPVPRTVQEKARRLLKALAQKTTFPGETIHVPLPRDNALGYCKNSEEAKFFIQHLEDQGWILHQNNTVQNKPGTPKIITQRVGAILRLFKGTI